MNILIVCSCAEEYITSSMLCLELLCKGFLENGHKVVFVSPLPNKNNKYYNEKYFFEHENLTHLRFGKTIEKIDNSLNNKKSIKNRIVNLLLKVYRSFDLFGKSIETLKYSNEIKEKIVSESFEPDILFSASDPKTSHILASKIIDIFKKRPYYMQYWGDPLTLDIASRTLTPVFIRKRIESSLLKKADKIIYVSPLTLSEQQNYFKEYSDKMEYRPTPCEIKTYKNSVGKCIGYFGSYNTSVRDIKQLYNAVNENKNYKLIIVGDSDLKLDSTEYVEVIDRLPAAELERYYDICDIIVDLTNNFGAQIPAKIFRDAGTNKEVLLICNAENGGDVKNYFSQFNRFTICENSCESIIAALENYNKNGIPERVALKDFNYLNVSRSIIDILNERNTNNG